MAILARRLFCAFVLVFVPSTSLLAQDFTGTPGQAEKRASVVFRDLPHATSADPAPVDSFQGLDDTSSGTPPDTMGAVGPRQIVTMLNFFMRVVDRFTGESLTVSHSDFWSALSPGFPFDPRIHFDPYGQRWIAAACAQPFGTDSAALLAVSQTADAAGGWSLYAVPASSTKTAWADFTRLGWNRNWIVIAANMEPIPGAPFAGEANSCHLWIFDKADVYAGGTGRFTLIEFTETQFQGFDLFPASTYDAALPVLYVLKLVPNPAEPGVLPPGLRVHQIDGPVGSETLRLKTFIPAPQSWPVGRGQFAGPQLGSPRQALIIEKALGNVVYRNGSLWTTHNSFLTTETDRTSIQWWQVTPEGAIQQFGRLTDPDGLISYGFPSLAVTSRGDMLLGYSRFSPTEYISGNLSYRYSFDPPGTLRGDLVAKAGEATYDVDNGGGGFRWGDFSHTVPDPTDDLSLWTIQQYAASPPGHWAVWWKRISFGAPVALFIMGSDVPTAAELLVQRRLEGLGYQVAVKSGAASATSDAAGKAIVLISSTVTSSDVNTKFRTVPVPILCWESALFDDLGMTGPRATVDYGTAGLQTSMTVLFPDHPLAAGLSGTVALVTSPSIFSWGAPNGNAILIGRPAGSSTRAAVFAYDAGTEMPGLIAPARRVGFFLEDQTASTLTTSGWKLFDAAVRWAVPPPARPALLVTSLAGLSRGDEAVRRRLQVLGYPVVVRTDGASVGSDAEGKSLVLISSTVESSRVGTKFSSTSVGILNWENRLLDDLGMTGGIPGVDFGTSPLQSSVEIVNPAHPLAAGLSGVVPVVTRPATMSWGRAPSAATVIATLPSNPARAVIFGVLPTSAGVPGRRLHFFLEDDTGSSLNGAGWALFDAAVAWVSVPSAAVSTSIVSAPVTTSGADASHETPSRCGATGLEILLLLGALRRRRRRSTFPEPVRYTRDDGASGVSRLSTDDHP